MELFWLCHNFDIPWIFKCSKLSRSEQSRVLYSCKLRWLNKHSFSRWEGAGVDSGPAAGQMKVNSNKYQIKCVKFSTVRGRHNWQWNDNSQLKIGSWKGKWLGCFKNIYSSRSTRINSYVDNCSAHCTAQHSPGAELQILPITIALILTTKCVHCISLYLSYCGVVKAQFIPTSAIMMQ